MPLLVLSAVVLVATIIHCRAQRGAGALPDPEVVEKAKRWQLSPEHELRILREADACRGAEEIGALLRREGLYSSHLVTWRRQPEARALTGMKAQKRGPKGRAEAPRVKQLVRENARLQRQLRQAVTIIDIQEELPRFWGSP